MRDRSNGRSIAVRSDIRDNPQGLKKKSAVGFNIFKYDTRSTKFPLVIGMRIARHIIQIEIIEEEYEFVDGKGANYAIYKLRTPIDVTIVIQKCFYLCFNDYTL